MLIRDKLRSEQWSLAVSVFCSLLNVFWRFCFAFLPILFLHFPLPFLFFFFRHFRNSLLAFRLRCSFVCHLMLVFWRTTWWIVCILLSWNFIDSLCCAFEISHFGELLQILAFFFNPINFFETELLDTSRNVNVLKNIILVGVINCFHSGIHTLKFHI